jgi:hypothetical protein
VGPTPFGKYLLVEKIAQGGMAEVFRALYQAAAGVEKTVALKRILPVLHGAKDFVDMFIDEARVACSLTHVNIAQVFDFGEVDGSYYLAMELIEGADLGRLLEASRRRGVPLPPAMVAFAMAEAARGLGYAHDKRGPSGALVGIVHRDISPQNVLVSYSGEVKIADFGIAKAAGRLHKTESGAVMGKLRYMSPEQVTGEPLDGRSDLFSLGVVMHELLTGKQLFDGEHPGNVSDQVKTAQVKAPSQLRAEVPGELDRVCLKLLARARDQRYQRAADVARDLSAFVAQAAPGLGRDELGTLVADLVPRAAAGEDPERTTLEGGASTVEFAPTLAAGATPSLSRFPTPSGKREGREDSRDPGPQTPTRQGHRTPQPAPPAPSRSSRTGLLAVIGVLLAGGAALMLMKKTPSVVVVNTNTDGAAAAGADASSLLVTPTTITDAERAKLAGELDSLPRVSSTRRGVPGGDYLLIMNALDESLCGAVDRGDPPLAGAALARLTQEQLERETRALGRYLLAAGELPPQAGAAFTAFLRSQPAYSTGNPGWSLAALAVKHQPGEPRHLLALMRQNSALSRWRNTASFAAAAPGNWAALCDRASMVERYAALAPGPRAESLRRYLAATPLEAGRDHDGLRWQVTSGEREAEAARLSLRVRISNMSAIKRSVQPAAAKLGGTTAPAAMPDLVLEPGEAKEQQLLFSPVSDADVEAAVLAIQAGIELQAYSELLR